MDRVGVPYLTGYAPTIPYGEKINAGLMAWLLAGSEGGVCGPRPPFVWKESNVCIFRGRLSPSSLEVSSEDDDGMWEGMW